MAAIVDQLIPRSLNEKELRFFRTMRARAISAPNDAGDAGKAGMPYIAEAILALKPMAVPGLKTFAVDSHARVYIDFDQAEEWGLFRSTTVFLHETLHVIMKHSRRYDSLPNKNAKYSRILWNQAADAEINDDLDRQGYVLPDIEYVTPARIRGRFKLTQKECPEGWAAEQYYRLLARSKEEDSEQDEPGAGDVKDKGDEGSDQVCSGGSGAGNPQSWEISEGDERAPGLSEGRQEVLRKTIAEKISREIKSGGKHAGSIPAGLKRWAQEELEEPKVNWRQQLNSKLQRAARVVAGDQITTYSRVSRRNPHPRILLPTRLQRIPQVAIRIDTSASMNEKDLKSALEETLGILKNTGSHGEKVDFGTVDAHGYGSSKVSRISEITLKGGGGTDMRIAFQEIAEQRRPKNNIGIIMTDCGTPWPLKNPDPSIRWVVVGIGRYAQGASDSVPKWADVVIVDEEN